ncbi:putative polysaccharide biosynthesis protein [Schleiferilactobacillus perolens]|jgi:O-antigen/teichoic acid export membrane protein|uniref:Drug Na(+) antiporter (Drug efflux pump) n=1 Tax=Schleiferilactobacillus perolens DSM 12744 TaxID=1423792 RepID=A0A0R1MUA7_9LACO|nr:polysaccharide biosynthesis protein [Schleiferilactobacillus perolens]KRL08442.1 drug Na(+) antiporter (drug efflux pump) [Schleiferilactobacillus perolens DSM 12744]MCI1892560.1 polysaccharide biosynthesis protein [Schleiferilactobacillus harbinensis]MCI1912905.1 polysaccharide biosynthesis protein [Schleiferilactobacillus harbinensis]MCI2170579.1 polysaccharide biosynthesis protein [Schleiferilactobacillus perolens]
MSEEKQSAPVQRQNAANTDRKSLVVGSAWMTAGSIISRVLGAIYVIPWGIWMGSHFHSANALFGRGYNIYSIFIIISTVGIPGAISKQISHYNSLNEYGVSRRLFYQGLILMSSMGFVAAAILYFGAPILGAGDPRMTPILQSLSWPLILIPPLSILRGYFQGFSEMAPSAISQLLEQVARLVYILGSTFVIMKMIGGNYVTAVAHSTFAAFIGAAVGLIYLVYLYMRQTPRMNEAIAQSDQNLSVSTRQIITDIMRQAAPFIILDASVSLYQMFDQYTFNPFMDIFYKLTRAENDYWYQLFGFNSNKLIMIIVSLATSMAITVVPILSSALARRDMQSVREQINNTLELFFFVMLPSSLGMAAVSQPLNTVFYRYDPWGTMVLQFNSYIAIIIGLFTVLAAILQGVYLNKQAIRYLLYGAVFKISLQYSFIYFFGVFGPLATTAVGFFVSSVFMLALLYREFHFRMGDLIVHTTQILVFSTIMFAVVYIAVYLMNFCFSSYDRVLAMVELVVAAGAGAAIYGYLVLHFRVADRLLGARVAGIRRRLHMK